METIQLGGYREKTKFRDGQRRLLDALWVDYGGVSEIANVYGISPQSLINWRLKGGVPFHHIGSVAEILDVPAWALNYTGLSGLGVAVPPSWESVVKACKLPPEVTEYVLKGTYPSY